MNWLQKLARRLGMLIRWRQFDAELEEEVRLHLELRQQEQIESGMTADDAWAAALRRFGNVTALRERSHLAWGWESFEHLAQDVNHGVRAMLPQPGDYAGRLALYCPWHRRQHRDFQPPRLEPVPAFANKVAFQNLLRRVSASSLSRPIDGGYL